MEREKAIEKALRRYMEYPAYLGESILSLHREAKRALALPAPPAQSTQPQAGAELREASRALLKVIQDRHRGTEPVTEYECALDDACQAVSGALALPTPPAQSTQPQAGAEAVREACADICGHIAAAYPDASCTGVAEMIQRRIRALDLTALQPEQESK